MHSELQTYDLRTKDTWTLTYYQLFFIIKPLTFLMTSGKMSQMQVLCKKPGQFPQKCSLIMFKKVHMYCTPTFRLFLIHNFTKCSTKLMTTHTWYMVHKVSREWNRWRDYASTNGNQFLLRFATTVWCTASSPRPWQMSASHTSRCITFRPEPCDTIMFFSIL